MLGRNINNKEEKNEPLISYFFYVLSNMDMIAIGFYNWFVCYLCFFIQYTEIYVVIVGMGSVIIIIKYDIVFVCLMLQEIRSDVLIWLDLRIEREDY